jgi:predicted metal-dependent hydrolase
MPQRRATIPEIGEVILAKRRGAKNIRLSVTSKGEVRISMPNWTPYSAGVAFARSRADWINSHLQNYQTVILREDMLVGKAHRLHFKFIPDRMVPSTRVTASTIEISSRLPFDDPAVQAKAAHAAEKALRKEAEILLPQRLAVLAKTHNFSYKQVKIRKLTSRWGSCSQYKTIALSYYLMQLPWQLIDYVLLHELTHTEHLNHGPDFWAGFERVLPGARGFRKEIRAYKPRLEPN